MTIIEPGSAAAGIVDRAKNIILQPSVEFDRIDQETPTIGSLYKGYAMPLAAASAIASAIGAMVFGYSVLFANIKISPLDALTTAVVSFVLMMVGVWVAAKIIDWLAPNFGAQRNELKATQTAIYASTAGWVAGLFGIFPPLSILSILGLYSIYLLYRALPRLMKAPAEKALGYTAAIVVIGIVAGIVAGAIIPKITSALPFAANKPSVLGHHADPNTTVTVPGVGSVKVGDIEAKTKELEAMAASMKDGSAVPAIPVDTLKTLLPESLPGGFTRTEVSTGSGGAMGFSGTTATGTYTRGDSRLEVNIIDMGAAGAIVGMASMFGVEATTENANGFSKTHMVDGRMTQEEYDREAKTASLSVVAAQRVAISASGSNISFDDVKAAIDAVGIARVETLAKAAAKG